MTKYFLPGWKLSIDKTLIKNSKLVYFNDEKGKIIVDGEISEKNIEIAIAMIFEKEREDSNNWSKFLYDLLMNTINPETILFHNYAERAYKSWIIRGHKNMEIEYDGRDENLNLIKRKPSLRAIVSIQSKNITYKSLIEISERI